MGSSSSCGADDAPLELRVVMLGLNGAGKTTILTHLSPGNETIHSTNPTLGFNVDMIPHKNMEFTIWDVGGEKTQR